MRKSSLFYKPKPRTNEIKKKRWHGPTIAMKVLRRTCMTLGAFMLIWLVLGLISFAVVGPDKPIVLPDNMVLVMKLEESIVEKPALPTLTNPFPYQQPTIRSVIEKIDAATKDDRVKGFVLSMKGGGVSLTHIEELRPALKRFREAGKFTKIYADSYADTGRGLGTYYLASAFDEIWMQPAGMLSVAGVSFEMPYGREALDKIGVTPQFLQREEYKGAMENFTNSEMTPESRETLNALLEDISATMLNDIANDRDITPVAMKVQIDKGLLGGEEALEAGLIDRLDYGDVLIDELDEKILGDKDSEEELYVAFADYHEKMERPSAHLHKAPQVALVHVTGAIMPGRGREGGIAAADDVANAIYDASEDDDIKAVVVRIDSPGGSPSASETIRRAIIRARERGTPVYVSMANTAASGGYWIASGADRIFALPSTLTGSIGVVMGKFVLEGLWEKLGINWQAVSYGENADLWSPHQKLDAQGTERMNTLIDDTYNLFLQRVSEGRGLSMEQTRAVAKGRAWTGNQAQERGLVDEIGGLAETLDYAAQELGKESRDDIIVTPLPREKKPFEQFMELLDSQASMAHFMKPLVSYMQTLGVVSSSPQLAYEPLGNALR